MDCKFYIVATPIGNLSDISTRAIETLQNADFIACEDTRVTRVLSEKFGFKARLIDCHKFNEKEKSSKIISLIEEGKTVAFVSDAGTPGISDPGSVLINELIKNDIKITSIPGACAVVTFLSMVPRQNEEFAFIGFIPRNKLQQIEVLEKYKYTNCVFYEAPNRLIETLKNILNEYGGNRKIAIGRELTKIYEEVKIDTVENIIEYYKNNTLKGELVCMLYSDESDKLSEEEIIKKIKILKKEGFSQKDITKILTKLFDINKNQIYKLAINFDN